MNRPLETLASALAAGPGPDLPGGAVVALSGGADSVALLHLLLAAGVPPDRLTVAHLDHGLRPDSGEDARFAAALAEEVGLPFRGGRSDLGDLALPGIEARARAARYRFLEASAIRSRRRLVLTAHHLDDQAETVLMRLMRGTGPTGLAGILPRRPIRHGSAVDLFRPLLGVRHRELVAWLASRGLPWREDPTNHDGSNLRSRVRNRLLPRLAEAVPDLVPRLAAVAERARLREGPLRPPPGLRPDPALARFPSLLRATLLDALPAGGPPLDRAAMERVLARIRAGRGDADLGAGYRLRVRADSVTVLTPRPETADPPRALPVPGEVRLPGGDRLVATESPSHAAGEPEREVVDRDRAGEVLSVRRARPGDRFRPLGFPRATTVFHFLAGQGVRREERRQALVVVSPEGPIWVVGHRIAERVKLTSATVRRLGLSRVRTSSSRPGRTPPSRPRP